MTKKNSETALMAVLCLGLQNVLIFSRHYFAGAGFPWDFTSGYYAVPYYWITAVQQGFFPQWVAQQAMGYPLWMNLQSGLFYPPFWVIVLLHKTYTMHTAVVLQCLHVLLGAVGMWYFARVQRLPWIYCLIAGIGYQFFGGFYCNAEHVDIIRGFALIPWLLTGLTVTNSRHNHLRAALLVPLSLLLLFTGAYMGLAIAALWMGGAWATFQILFDFKLKQNHKQKIFTLFYYYGLIFLGLLLSMIQLLPTWMQHQQIMRTQNYLLQPHSFFSYKNFFTAFLPCQSSALPQDVSMRSVFITLPLSGLLFMFSWQRIKENIPHILLLMLAALMITGSYFYHGMTSIFSVLGLSRFPSADYRSYIAIMGIFFAILALQDLLEKKHAPGFFLPGNLFFLALIMLGAYLLPMDIKKVSSHITLIISAVLFFMFMLLVKIQKFKAEFLLYILVLLVVFDGVRVWETDSFLWRMPGTNEVFKNQYQLDLDYLSEENLVKTFSGLLYRPSRHDTPGYPEFYSGKYFLWRGYLTGDFMMEDYTGGMQLSRQVQVITDPVLRNFMRYPSRYLLLPENTALSNWQLHQILTYSDAKNRPDSRIQLLRYANNGLIYQVHLSQPQILLENEMYFPGWQANLIDNKNHVFGKFSALEAGKGLRAWKLPAGNYTVMTYFEMPSYLTAIIISLIALFLWMALLIKIYIFQRSKKFIA